MINHGRKNSGFSSTPEEKEQVWNQVTGRIKARKRKIQLQWYAVASFILFFSLTGIIATNLHDTEQVFFADAGNLSITLEDGSEIELLEGGKLIVSQSFPEDSREVLLDGSAVFSVTLGEKHPFIVRGNGFQAKSLKSSFKVIQQDKNYEVELYTGKIEIQNASVKKYASLPVNTVLNPNQILKTYIDQRISVVKSLKTESVKKQGLIQLNFDDTRLEDIIHLINDTYEINIKYPQKFGGKKITGNLNNSDPETILNSIAYIINLKITKADEKNYSIE